MEQDRKSPATAFFLSLIPGVGHLYVGRMGGAIFWLAAVFLAYSKVPGLGVILHFFCAASAARAAQASNFQEREELRRRRESAGDVARMLDQAVERGGAASGAAASPSPPAGDPPPRIMRGAFPVPPESLVRAIARGMGGAGLLVLGVDSRNLRVRGSADLGGGNFTTAVAQVEPTPSGSRVRLMVDRPPGSPVAPERDDAILRDILERTEQALALGGETGGVPAGPQGPRPVAIVGEGEALTEDHFLEQLREAWESYEQGWLPEEEWLQRKASLVSGVVLRPGTSHSDFMAVCRPLVEAGVLDPEDLRALQRTR